MGFANQNFGLGLAQPPAHQCKKQKKRLLADLFLFFSNRPGKIKRETLTGTASKENSIQGTKIIKAKRIGRSTVQQKVIN